MIDSEEKLEETKTILPEETVETALLVDPVETETVEVEEPVESTNKEPTEPEAAEISEPEPVETAEIEAEEISESEPAESVNNEPTEPVEAETAASEKTEDVEEPQEPQASQEQQDPPAPVERKRKRGHTLRNLLLILLLICAGVYGFGTYYYSTHFWKNTFINGLDVSGMTVEEAEAIFRGDAENYALTVKFREGKTETIPGSAFLYKARTTSRFGDIQASQKPYKWYRGFFKNTEAQIGVRTTYDDALLAEEIGKLPEMQPENMIAPVDAYITFETANNQFVIVPETDGTTASAEAVLAAVKEAVDRSDAEIDLTAVEGAYSSADVTTENEDLKARLETLNKYTTASITFDLPGGEKMVLNAEVTQNWLAKDENGNLYMDEELWDEKILLYVDEIAAKVNTVGKDRSFKATNRGTITVTGGDYGYSVNKVKEIEEIKSALEDGDVLEREPHYYHTEFGSDRVTNDGIGSTYIEVNLSAQHAWIYIDGVNVCDTDFVSGNTSLGRGTPTGVFQILYKDTNVDLKGQRLADGQYSYVSHVNYWMPFYNGCGFHDADWRSSFGGSIYKTNGSHGCVNLPPSIAPVFYRYVQSAMPVIVFY